MNLNQLMHGYLSLMVHNNPSEKPLEIITIAESQSVEELTKDNGPYDILLSEAKSHFNLSLKFTLPVIYEASNVPATDALQVVSQISSRYEIFLSLLYLHMLKHMVVKR